MMQTTNKFSNSYGFQMNGGGVASPRQTSTTHFGHNIHHNIGVPEEENVDIECSIEEKIEENISRLGGYERDVQPIAFRRQQSPPPLFKQVSSNAKSVVDPLQVTAQIPPEQPNTAGFIELNMHNDSSADEAENTENVNQNTFDETPLN
jgi:hypothetical protein